MRRRCPLCGQRRLFRRWVSMVETCPGCRLTFRRVPGQWLGSWFLNICLTQVLVLGVLLAGAVAAYPSPNLVVLSAAGVAMALVFPLWFFPYSRTIWLAIDLAMRPPEFDEGVDPMVELAELERAAARRSRARGRTRA